MRYHWGLGVGLLYSRQDNEANPTAPSAPVISDSVSSTASQCDDCQGISEEHIDNVDEDNLHHSVAVEPVDECDSPEHSLENMEDDFLDVDDPRPGVNEDDEVLEDGVLEMLEDMFGPDEDDWFE